MDKYVGKDVSQFERLSKFVRPACSFLFVGCNNGDEISSCQSVIKKRALSFAGVDMDAKAVASASGRKFETPVEFACADITKDKITKAFDIVVCRNLLLYYDAPKRKLILEKLSEMTKDLLVLGISDPFDFAISKVIQIGNSKFDVLDFENRIFRKQSRLVNTYF